MRILVTGATGFIGRHLVKALAKKTKHLRCLVRKGSAARDLDRFDLCQGDILDKNSLMRATKNIDFVFHLVGIGSITDYSQSAFIKYKKINVGGTRNFLEACEKNKIRGFVYFSSLAAQGVIPDKVISEEPQPNPQTPYEKSKYQSELVVEKFRKRGSFPIIIIRPAMVYGPGAKNSDILFLARLIKKHLCPIIGDGKNVLPLVYVKDLVRAIVKLVDKDKLPNKTYNITREDPIEYQELLESIRQALEVPCIFLHIPIAAAKFGAQFLKFFSLLTKKPPIVTPMRIDSLTANRLYDVSLAQKDLGFHSANLFQTIKETVDWYKENKYL